MCSRPPCSIVAGYAGSHPFMVFNRVVSLLTVGLVVVGSLENSWLVGVFMLSCVWIEVHSSSSLHVVGFLPSGHTPCILCLYTYFCSWSWLRMCGIVCLIQLLWIDPHVVEWGTQCHQDYSPGVPANIQTPSHRHCTRTNGRSNTCYQRDVCFFTVLIDAFASRNFAILTLRDKILVSLFDTRWQ